MTLDSYIQSLHGKSIAVIGLGVSNRPLLRLLLDAGYTVTVRDKRTREALGEDEAAALEAAGCRLVLGDGYLAGITEDVIFRTPGLHPFTPELAAAKARGALLTSEMEAFFTVCPCRIIAITGSDGKTTTSTITAELLRAQGYTVHLGGNIGTPLFDRIPDIRPEDFAVLELSSFQLHSMHCADRFLRDLAVHHPSGSALPVCLVFAPVVCRLSHRGLPGHLCVCGLTRTRP